MHTPIRRRRPTPMLLPPPGFRASSGLIKVPKVFSLDTSGAFGFKKQRGSKPRSGTPTRSVTPTRDRTRSLTYSYERQKRAPSAHTIVRREHQAHCAHPAVGITSTEPGGLARLRKTICKLKRFVNDLERSTDILCRWSALIVVTIIASRTARISASSAR